jgi:tRNA modification GTPase
MSMTTSPFPDQAIDAMAAVATAPGEGAIAVIRISGPGSLTVADRVFRPAGGKRPSERPSHTVCFGRLIDPESGAVVDEALLLIMRSPNSFTGEDVVELQTHGGRIASARALHCALRAGARPAEPGEFTRRAFLNGRMDMLQAESILDLVRAQSDMAASQAVEQLEGGLSREINSIYDTVLEASSALEATLDFSEDDVPEPVISEIGIRLADASRRMAQLCATWEEGRILREGLRVVIAGRPNAGKSSLFNLLLNIPRAIVHARAGTTRDTIEESAQWSGLPIRLVDTAGLRESACEIEQEGVRRSHAQRAAADLVLFVVDIHAPPHPDECALIAARPARRLILGNKADLGRHAGWDSVSFNNEILLSIATDPTRRESVINEIQTVIKREFIAHHAHAVSISARHRAALAAADAATRAAAEELRENGLAGSVPACDRLQEAMDHLGQLTGRVYSKELLDSVFRRFCIGK